MSYLLDIATLAQEDNGFVENGDAAMRKIASDDSYPCFSSFKVAADKSKHDIGAAIGGAAGYLSDKKEKQASDDNHPIRDNVVGIGAGLGALGLGIAGSRYTKRVALGLDRNASEAIRNATAHMTDEEVPKYLGNIGKYVGGAMGAGVGTIMGAGVGAGVRGIQNRNKQKTAAVKEKRMRYSDALGAGAGIGAITGGLTGRALGRKVVGAAFDRGDIDEEFIEMVNGMRPQEAKKMVKNYGGRIFGSVGTVAGVLPGMVAGAGVAAAYNAYHRNND